MGPCWSWDQPKLQQRGMINDQDRSSHWVSLLTNTGHGSPVGPSAFPLPRIMNVNHGISVSSPCSQSTGWHFTQHWLLLYKYGRTFGAQPGAVQSRLLPGEVSLVYRPIRSRGVCPRCCFWAGESLGNVSLAPNESLSFWLKTWDRQ